MSRRKQAEKRSILPDPKFGSDTVAKFVNMVMESGKKSVAERIVYGAFDGISQKKGDPIAVRLWRSAGSLPLRAAATRILWSSVCQASCSTQPITAEPR